MTNAELAVLSLVVEQPRHGYNIEQTIVERNMREWTEVGFSSIYYLLDKLETSGLVTSKRESTPGRGPARRVYSATSAGAAVAQAQALRSLVGPAHRHSAFQLGLAALPWLNPDQVAAAIVEHDADLELRLETLRERHAEELPFHVAAMFDLGINQLEAELEWIRRFATSFEKNNLKEGSSQ